MHSGQQILKQLEQFNSYWILLVAPIANASLESSTMVIFHREFGSNNTCFYYTVSGHIPKQTSAGEEAKEGSQGGRKKSTPEKQLRTVFSLRYSAFIYL